MASKAPKVFVNSLGQRFRLIPKGSFTMGNPDYDEMRRTGPPHAVTLSRRFWLGETTVTRSQWQRVMGTEPWLTDCCIASDSPDQPATMVTWSDASKYCRRLSRMRGRKYFLPTEAQWEYACRAGTTSLYSFDFDVDNDWSASALGEYAWYEANSGQEPSPVGKKKANPWGLYDMHGNVQEWCRDKWGCDYPPAIVDPIGTNDGYRFVIRGGSWVSPSMQCEAAERYGAFGGMGQPHIGFRVGIEPLKHVLPQL
jgi:formylglycine-generating enzyme required for sulfatase activity